MRAIRARRWLSRGSQLGKRANTRCLTFRSPASEIDVPVRPSVLGKNRSQGLSWPPINRQLPISHRLAVQRFFTFNKPRFDQGLCTQRLTSYVKQCYNSAGYSWQTRLFVIRLVNERVLGDLTIRSTGSPNKRDKPVEKLRYVVSTQLHLLLHEIPRNRVVICNCSDKIY